MKINNKGFTLMEMLIVVAIIAVLVAIAIPTFSNSLEKSREAVDEANIRSAYAQVVADGMLGITTAPAKTDKITYTYGTDSWTATVEATQEKENWTGSTPIIGGSSVGYGKSWTITYVKADNNATITPNSN